MTDLVDELAHVPPVTHDFGSYRSDRLMHCGECHKILHGCQLDRIGFGQVSELKAHL